MAKSNSQKGAVEISTIAAMVIVAAVVVIVSIIVTMQYYEVLNATQPVVVITPKLTSSVTPTPILATPTPLATTPAPTPNLDITTWKTYRNDNAGFSLKYPGEWGPVKEEEFRKSIAGKGEEFYTIFSNNNFIIGGNTADFEPYENQLPVYLGGNPLKYCEELKKQVISIIGCEKNNKNIYSISYGFYSEIGMFGSGKEINFQREVIIDNQSNKYKALSLVIRFPAYQNDKLIDMNKEQISNIAKNELLKIDKKTINIFNQILSTFKFTK